MAAPEETPPPVLSLRGVGKTYPSPGGDVHALRAVDLDLFAGELVVMLGPSGSGKSTLLHVLGGLDAPTRGVVRFRGRELSFADAARITAYRRTQVGFVFQFYHLIPSLTARENVALAADVAKAPMAADEALALVGLTPRADHFPAQLSGGEQQRVAIARAIVKRPAVLLCDEPTGALDAATGRTVLQALQRIHRQLGIVTVLITHNAAIGAMADRVLCLHDGAIARELRNATPADPATIGW
jgi:putative ABC transport system ATP-binding protein